MSAQQAPHNDGQDVAELELQEVKPYTPKIEQSSTNTTSSSSDLDFEGNFEKSGLLRVEGTGCLSALERIPLPVKLVQISVLAVIGMIALGAIVIALRSVDLSRDNAILHAITQKNTLYSALDAVYNERQTTIRYFSMKSTPGLLEEMDRSRPVTDQTIANLLGMSMFKGVVNGTTTATDIDKLTNAYKGLVSYRGYMDSFKKVEIVDFELWYLVMMFVGTMEDVIMSLRSFSGVLAYTKDSTSNSYAQELMAKLSQVSHDLFSSILLVLGFGKNTGMSEAILFVNIATQYSAMFDTVENFVFDQLQYTSLSATLKAQPYRATIYAMKANVINLLISNGTVAQISIPEWSGNMTQYLNILGNMAKDWRIQFEQEAASNTRATIAYIVVAVVGVLLAFIIILCNSFLISKTITGPWQRMNIMLDRAISRFVPRDFLYLMKCNDITDVALGKAFSHDLTVMSLKIKQSIVTGHETAPDVNIQILNQYFGFIGPIIRKHNGFIEKYFGQGCVAMFTKPKNAVYAALELDRSITGFCRGNPSLPVFSLTIGVHSDKAVVVGTVGETQRMEAAILSDTNRFASDIMKMCSKLKAKILISESCLHKVRKTWIQMQSRYMGKYAISAEQQYTESILYEVFEESDPRAKHVISFNEAMKLAEQGEVEGAIKTFQKILADDRSDAATEQQLQMCTALIEHYSKEIKELTLLDILANHTYREAFEKHLIYEMSNENMILWKTVQQVVQIEDPELMRQRALAIFTEFLDVNAKYQLNLNQDTVFAFKEEVMNDSKPFDRKILQCLQVQTEFIMMDSFNRFKRTPQLKQLLTSLKKEQQQQQHFD